MIKTKKFLPMKPTKWVSASELRRRSFVGPPAPPTAPFSLDNVLDPENFDRFGNLMFDASRSLRNDVMSAAHRRRSARLDFSHQR